MERLEIDNRSVNDIIEQIGEKAESYTPEWRFDPSNRDAGTALALIYAEMIKSTIGRLNMVPEKNRIAFYNKLGASLKPASPAEGYVTFGLVIASSTSLTFSSRFPCILMPAACG